MPHTPTPEQSTIISSVSSSPSSLMIQAYAGCAKSSTLKMAAPGIKVPALALAFNKKIASELKPDLPGNFDTKTLNGLGHSVWLRSLPSPRVNLDDRKLGKLVTAVAKEFHIPLPSWQWDAVRRLVTLAQQAGISPNDEGDFLTPDTPESWSELCDLPSMDDFPLTHELAHTVLSTSNRLARQGHISFDDQIYCPTILGGAWPLFPVVFIDESQDLSPLNHQMLRKVLRPGGRLVAVGDPRQAIYAFRGADSDSMSNMRQLQGDWLDHRLTLTFRCPRSIVARQQSHAPGFQAFQTNIDGTFSTWPPEGGSGETTSDLPSWGFKHIQEAQKSVQSPSVAILCRNNAPLLSLAFKLLRRSIGCTMLGRDIGKGLQQLSSKLAPDDSTPITQVMSKIHDWREREVSLALANDKPSRAERITDQAECLIAVAEGTSPQTAGDLRTMLSKLFDRSADPIVLSTIHRAKGLEWPTVIHLDPWRVPSKQSLRKGGADLQQELNLIYVAETRTQNTLINANLADFR